MSKGQKIKIVRIVTRLNVGGPSFHTILLTAHLDNKRFETVLVRGCEGKNEGSMDHLADSKGVKPVRISEMQREVSPWQDVKSVFRIYQLLKREKPDIVHTHLAKAGLVGRLAALLAGGSKIVHTFHGHSLHGYWGKTMTSIFMSIERFFARRSDCLIAVSDRVRSDLVDAGIVPSKKILTIHLGLELERFTQLQDLKGQFRKELGIDDSTVLVGIIARLVPIKNHKLFIEAVSKIGCGKVKFVIIGDGELRGELEELVARHELAGSVVFTGFRNDLENIYSDLDISVISSLNEGLPVAVIESMTAGVPVVSTDVGGVRELIDDGINGFVVPSGDSDMLAGQLEALISDSKLRTEFSVKAASKVYPYHEYTRLVSDIEDLYECLMQGKSFKHVHLRNYAGHSLHL